MPTNVDVAWPLQLAVRAKLMADAELMADISGVFDHVPEDTSFPYVTIGAFTVTPQGAHDRFGARSTITLHGWSTHHGTRETLVIADHLMRLLDHQTLAIDGHHTVAVRHEQTVTMRDPDADLRHVACRFSVETEYVAA